MYTVNGAARLAEVNPSRLRQWLGSADPVIHRTSQDAITYLDLIEALVIGRLRRLGVSMTKIRAARAEAVELFGTEHPFAHAKIRTDGRTVFAHLSRSNLHDLVGRQGNFKSVIEPFLREQDFGKDGLSARWWPLGKQRPVFVDPKIAFGVPVVKEGIPAEVLASARAAGRSLHDVADGYEVSIASVRAAVELMSRVTRRRAA